MTYACKKNINKWHLHLSVQTSSEEKLENVPESE